MAPEFNPVVDSIPDDQILFYYPDKKKVRNIEDAFANDTVDTNELLKKLLEQSEATILTLLEKYFYQLLDYLQISKTFIISSIVVFLSVYVLELFTHLLFIYMREKFKSLQLKYLKKINEDQPGHYYFRKRTKLIKLKPTRAETKQYLRCRRAIKDVLFV